jgi:hypothetical protein
MTEPNWIVNIANRKSSHRAEALAKRKYDPEHEEQGESSRYRKTERSDLASQHQHKP